MFQNFKKREILGMEFAGIMLLKKVIIEKSFSFPPAAVLYPGTAAHFSDVKKEAFRKTIHLFIALAPSLAVINYQFSVLLLVTGILSYTVMELLRQNGVRVPLVSDITAMVCRRREKNRFVLGPVTLGIGTLVSLLVFPPPVAYISIFALALGDGLSSIAGQMFGNIRPRFLFGKSVEGSAACFAATFFSAWLVSHSHIVSLTAAVTATVIEALPLKDYDNIALPLAVGFAVQLL